MENPTTSPNQVAFKWSAVYLITGIVLTYVVQLTNLNPDSPIKYIGYALFIVFLILVQREYKSQLGGYLSFGEGFGAGFKYSLFGGIMMGVFMFVYISWLNPGMLDRAMDSKQEQMQAQGLTQDQIDVSIGIAKKFGGVIVLFVTIIADIIFGAIIALIGAAIFKNEKPMFTGEDYQSVEQQN